MEDSLHRKKIDMALVNMMVEDLQPPSIVEDVGFQKLLKVMDQRYIPPSRRSIMRDHLPQLFASAKADLKGVLNDVDCCSITTDLWTSRTTISYMTVTCHFLTNDWELKSVVLETPRIDVSHTAENLAATLLRIADEWGIRNKISCATTDNANNIVAAIRITGWPHAPCFAHTINLVVTNSVAEVKEVEELIHSCKRIVSFFHRSTKASDALKKVQDQLKIPDHQLIQHVETRWNSVFYMMERIVEQDTAISMALCLLDRNDLIITTERISLAKEIIATLRPFEQVTREMSADTYVSISKIIPLSNALQRLTVVSNGACGTLGARLKDRMKRKFLGIEENHLLASSTMLDPRLKKLAFADSGAAERACTGVASNAAFNATVEPTQPADEAEVETMQTGNGGRDEGLWQLLDQCVADTLTSRSSGIDATTEMKKYVQMRNANRKEDPISWWKQHNNTFPILSKAAKKYLSIPGTSVPSERLFSTAGEVVSAKRNRLTPANVNMFLFYIIYGCKLFELFIVIVQVN